MSAGPVVLPDARAAAEACGRCVLASLSKALSEAPFVTLAVSGGSTPKLLFDWLAGAGFSWDRVHLFWVDERCVPPDSPQSNYGLARERLIAPARIPEENIHRVRGELEPQQAAARYADEIRRFFGLAGGALPRFDVVHRGMGPDAHTASLFPGEPLIADTQGIAAAVFAPQFQQWRVTLLPGVLSAAGTTVMLVAGADKTEALRAVLQGPYDPMKYPAQIAARQAVWFVDRAAAGQ